MSNSNQRFITGNGQSGVQHAAVTPNLPPRLATANRDVSPEIAEVLAALTMEELRAVVAAAQSLIDNGTAAAEDKPTDRPERQAKRRFDAHAHNTGVHLGAPRGFLAK